MPTYKFHNKDTGEVWEEFMGISAADDMAKDNPHIERVNGAPGLVGGTGDRTKAGWWVQGSPIKNIRGKSNLCPCEHLRSEGCKIRCGKKFGAKT